MAVLVFDDPKAPRTTPLTATEPPVSWFLKSTRPQASEARRVVNDMYERFPDASRSLRGRLRSRNDATQRSALDELPVHDLLSRSYRVEYENVATGPRPDFALFDGEEHMATVEVFSLMLRGEWQDERQRHGLIETELNRRLRPNTADLRIAAGRVPVCLVLDR